MVLVDNNQNGIVKVQQSGKEYTVWTHAKVVRPYIRKFLQERFPENLIVRELNRVDFSIPGKNLPIEIQATIVGHSNTKYASIHYATWENNIRTQIDRNIVPHELCWFFFDSELLTCMKNATRGMDISMDWFRQYMKEDKLKVFTVSHEGVIEEKTYKDFDFLSRVSRTCKLASETDDMILDKNKMIIFANVVKGYGFTQKDILKIEGEYEKYCDRHKIDDDKNDRMRLFLKKQKDEKYKLYGYILDAIGNLPAINQVLDRNGQSLQKKYLENAKYHAKILGIFESEGYTQKCITRFEDRFDICKYSPGFLKNEKTWTRLRGHKLNNRQFDNMTKNTNNGITIDNYFWYEKSNDDSCKQNESVCEEEDKEINLEIKNSDQIVTIDIKKNDSAGW